MLSLNYPVSSILFNIVSPTNMLEGKQKKKQNTLTKKQGKRVCIKAASAGEGTTLVSVTSGSEYETIFS